MSKKNTLRPAESLNPFETHASEKLVRADRICLLVLTLLYGLIALLNLGTLNFPESVYYGDTGDTFTLTFDAPVTLAEAWCNGNIATGSLTFTNEEGESWTYTQDQGAMFKWHKERWPSTRSPSLMRRATCSRSRLRQRERLWWMNRAPCPTGPAITTE